MAGIRQSGYERQLGPGGSAPLPTASPDAFGAQVGAAIEQAGGQMTQHDLDAHRLELEQRKASEASAIGVNLARVKAALPDITKELRIASPPDGAGHVDQVNAALDKQFGTVMDGIQNTELRQRFAPIVEDMRAQVRGEETAWAHGQRAEFKTNNFEQTGNLLANQEALHPSASLDDQFKLIDTTAASLGVTANVATQAALEQKRKLVEANQRAAIDQDPQAGLQLVESGKYSQYQRPEDIAQLRQYGEAKVREQQAEARRQLSEGLSQFEQGARIDIQNVHGGVQVDPVALNQKAGQAETYQKPELAHELRIAAAQANVQIHYAAASPTELQGALHEIERTHDWQKDDTLVANHTALQGLYERIAREAQNDKLNLWSQHGGIGLAQLDLTDPNSVRTRIAQAKAAQNRYPVGPLQILTEAEAGPIRDQFAKGGADDKANAIAVFSAYGADVGKAAMRQIAPLKPEYATLVDLATMRNRVAGAQSMREALNGWTQLAANPKLIADNGATLMQRDLDSAYGPAMAMLDGVTRQGIMKVAQGIYANEAAQAAVAGGRYDRDLWLKSVQRALGAGGDNTGGIGRTRGNNPVVLPRGMTSDDLDHVIARSHGPEIEEAAGHDAPLWGGRGMSAAEFKTLVPVAAGDGLYMFRSRTGFAKSKAHPGANFVLDVRALAKLTRGR